MYKTIKILHFWLGN